MLRVLSKEIQEAVMHYLGNECNYCGKNKGRLEIHHTIPLSRGGLNRLGNLEITCPQCHQQLHKQINRIIPVKKYIELPCEKCGKIIIRKINIDKKLCLHCRNKKYYADKKLS